MAWVVSGNAGKAFIIRTGQRILSLKIDVIGEQYLRALLVFQIDSPRPHW